MHAMALLADNKLGEYRCQTTVRRGISDPLLMVVVGRRVDDELVSGRVVRRSRLEVADV